MPDFLPNTHQHHRLIKVIQRPSYWIVLLILSIAVAYSLLYQPNVSGWFATSPNKNIVVEPKKEESQQAGGNAPETELSTYWHPALIENEPNSEKRKELEYGKDLIVHTAKYLGPKGSVARTTNGMNCQNCHLDAGTKIWGNNYGSVFSTYPKYRARSGTEEDIYKRVSDCFERSLNGKAPAIDSKEMQAIKSYIEYIGQNVKKGEKAKGSGIVDLTYLQRPADPVKGKELYAAKCQSCHQANGQGVLAEDKIEYIFPPLWGKNSYNTGAGLYRLSRFAGYIKNNMPQGITFQAPLLTDEEAWDIAAFVNSQPRPTKDLSKDWPKIEEKVFDHPFGPFADNFSEQQHKYGPFQPIKDEQKRQKEANQKLSNMK